jgi:hypothetical protein
MKKLLTLLLLIPFLLTAQQGTNTPPVGFGGLEMAAFQQRVIDSSGTYLPNTGAHDIDNLYSHDLYSDAILMMTPAGWHTGSLMSVKPSDGTGDFTVTRAAATGTTQTPSGYIAIAPANTPRFDYSDGTPVLLTEPQGKNELAYSEAFGNAAWSKSGATVEGDPSTAGVELVQDGDFTLSSPQNASTVGTYWTTAANWVIGSGVATISGMPGGTRDLTQTNVITTGLKTIYYSFDMSGYSTGSVSLILGGETIKSAADDNTFSGYYTATFTNSDLIFRASAGSGYSIDNVSIKEVQGFSCPMVDANGDNTLQGFKLVESATTSAHSMYKAGITVISGSNYANSIYAKGTERILQLVYSGTGITSGYCNFDLSDGTIGNNSSIVDFNVNPSIDGWYRIDIIGLTTGTSINIEFLLVQSKTSAKYQSYLGDGTSGIYIFGAQLETGSTATSYIPTNGTSATRNADVISVTTPAGVTEIAEYYVNGDSTHILPIPVTYTIANDSITKIIMR